MRIIRSFFVAAALLAVVGNAALAQTAVTFQQGVDGYEGLLDVYTGIGTVEDDMGDVIEVFFFQNLGSEVGNSFIDGICDSETTSGGDTQAWLLFDGILDSIPAGSEVVSATLTFTTSEQPFSGSGGPYGISRLLVPFDAETTYESAVSGFTFDEGEATRPLPNGFAGLTPGFLADADVTSIVQAWVDGEPNYGFVISAGTTDGWNVFTSNPFSVFDDGSTEEVPPEFSPLLTITFDEPGAEGPATTTVDIVQSADNPATAMFQVDVVDGIFTPGADLDPGGVFIDGDLSDGDPDLQALFRFDEIFMAEGGIVPDDAVITEANLILTTSACSFSTFSGTDDPYGVRAVLSDFDELSTFADIEFGEVVDEEFGMIQDSQAIFDVTSIIQDIQGGAANFGFNVSIQDSTNGWAFLPSSAPEFAPTLQVTFEGEEVVLGDVNGDGVLNLFDVAPFVDALTSGDFVAAADVNQDGLVDLFDVSPFVALLTSG